MIPSPSQDLVPKCQILCHLSQWERQGGLGVGERIKKESHPLKDQGWDTKYSTVPPWLQPQLPLIDALTGAPVRAFPPGGSEVVSPSVVLRDLSTNRSLSEQLTAAHVFVTAFAWSKCSTIGGKSQSLWRKIPIFSEKLVAIILKTGFITLVVELWMLWKPNTAVLPISCAEGGRICAYFG